MDYRERNPRTQLLWTSAALLSVAACIVWFGMLRAFADPPRTVTIPAQVLTIMLVAAAAIVLFRVAIKGPARESVFAVLALLAACGTLFGFLALYLQRDDPGAIGGGFLIVLGLPILTGFSLAMWLAGRRRNEI